MKKRIVVKLSGSLFGLEDMKTLKQYAEFFVKISKICQPIIIAGGGKIARHYITHARSSGADESTLDELGIEVSRLNAKLLIYALQEKAYPHPPVNLKEVANAADTGGSKPRRGGANDRGSRRGGARSPTGPVRHSNGICPCFLSSRRRYSTLFPPSRKTHSLASMIRLPQMVHLKFYHVHL